MFKRWFYSDSLAGFRAKSDAEIIGEIATGSNFSIETTQRDAWVEQIRVLRKAMASLDGMVYFEYSIPRMGRRVDVVALVGTVAFVIEFKAFSQQYLQRDLDQVWDYALDLKNFHETSHSIYLAPILVATAAKGNVSGSKFVLSEDKLLEPQTCDAQGLEVVVRDTLSRATGTEINLSGWSSGRYCPTPTIIEAATALYSGHSVVEISRSDAGATNLQHTSRCIESIISDSCAKSQKSICFVTGVPGAGKTLVGLDIATKHFNKESDLYSVFLSGNGPLVRVLREALVRDKVARKKERGIRATKKETHNEVKLFIQNVHNFRDDCLSPNERPPIEHVALFDEAQRAWNSKQTEAFMSRKRHVHDFSMSEPEFLISCLDRHDDWAVIVCLVGGGQEINTGEAGIAEWVRAILKSYPHWNVWLSSKITDSEYGAGDVLEQLKGREGVEYLDELHLSVSLRSFRSESVSLLVKQILDLDAQRASKTFESISNYPIVLCRDFDKAKRWVRRMARGSERYGMIVSSQAERLKPYAIDVRPEVDPIHWFLNGKDDVRSSYYMEDVATEFHIQGLELDWACVAWDGDLRYSRRGWVSKSFKGNRWQNILNADRQKYLVNAYRVLLTRARQGMAIVVPRGDVDDPTRLPEFYDSTYEYLKSVGIPELA